MPARKHKGEAVLFLKVRKNPLLLSRSTSGSGYRFHYSSQPGVQLLRFQVL